MAEEMEEGVAEENSSPRQHPPAKRTGRIAPCLAKRPASAQQAGREARSDASTTLNTLRQQSRRNQDRSCPALLQHRRPSCRTLAVTKMNVAVHGQPVPLSAVEARRASQWDSLFTLHRGIWSDFLGTGVVVITTDPLNMGPEGGGGLRMVPLMLHSDEEVCALEVIVGAARKWVRRRRGPQS